MTAQELERRLDILCSEQRPAALAFDADGTLWTGDVGEDLFQYAVDLELLREEARAPLAEMARRFGIHADGSATSIGKALVDGFHAGRLPNLEACELMTWGYAGMTLTTLHHLCREVSERKGLRNRMQSEVSRIVRWARSRGVRTIVVSASPRVAVKVGAALLDIPEEDIAAADPVIEGDVIQPRMGAPVPFGIQKCAAERALLGDVPCLAAFGDNIYDLDMLKAARLGVAVRPKDALLSAISNETRIVLLSPEDIAEGER